MPTLSLLHGGQNFILNAIRKRNLTLIQTLCETTKNLDYLYNNRYFGLRRYRKGFPKQFCIIGHTALHYAISKNNIDIIEFFVNKGCSLDVYSKSGMNALHISIVASSKQIVDYLLKKGANPLAITKGVGTRESSAKFPSYHGKWLEPNLESRQYIRRTGLYRVFPLHIAAFEGRADIVKLLLDNGADVNCKNPTGYTPLHYAVYNEYIPVIRVLLKYGADAEKTAKNVYGLFPKKVKFITALDIAENKENSKILRLLNKCIKAN